MIVNNNDIAIIGVSCRFPGHCNDIHSFWDLLASGTDAITTSEKRWGNTTALPTNSNGGFLDDVDCFDSSFFNILPKEAIKMDPQHRILLELHWEALESACIVPETIKRHNTGVFVGISWNQYAALSNLVRVEQNKLKDHYDLYLTTGTSHSISSGRISFCFDLRGPAVTVDTACSSSLVAVHLACQSLISGDCDMALASGVSLNLSPETSTNFTQATMLGDRCRAFDVNASGYVRSEGCAVLVLKRLADAIKDGNRLLGVIKGTSLNQDGHGCTGITAPNVQAQQEIYFKTLQKLKLQPRDIHYIEAHGTGTSVGDPAELESIVSVFGNSPKKDYKNIIGIGSVKTNIGHTEMAAGLAGILKIILALEHEFIPPHLHFTKPNPKSPNLAQHGLEILSKGKPWPKSVNSQTPRLAIVSSFGFSGTNANAIIQESPFSTSPSLTPVALSNMRVLTLSSKTKSSLDALTNRYIEHFKKYYVNSELNNPQTWHNVAYTTNVGRTHFPKHRIAVVASDLNSIVSKLSAQTNVFSSASTNSTQPKLTNFLFTGIYDTQLIKTSLELFNEEFLFQEIIQQCSNQCSPLMATPLMEFIFDPDKADHKKNKSLVILVLEYAIAQLMIKLGIQPNTCTCYGLGEYAAATVCGIINLFEAAKLVLALGELTGDHHAFTRYEALAINKKASFILKEIQRMQIKNISLYDTENKNVDSTVVFGKPESVTKILNTLKTDHYQTLSSFQMPNKNAKKYVETLNSTTFKKAEVEMVCGTSRLIISKSTLISVDFWLDTRFNSDKPPSVITSPSDEKNMAHICIGIGNDVLKWKQEDGNLMWLNPVNVESMYDTLALLYTLGHNLDFKTWHKNKGSPNFIELPKYAFDKKKLWYPSVPLNRKNASTYVPEKLYPEINNTHQPFCRSELDEPTYSLGLTFPEQMLEELEKTIPDCWSENVQRYEDTLEELSRHHILKAFVNLQVPKQLQDLTARNVENVSSLVGIAEKHLSLFQHFVAKLSESGYLQYDQQTDMLKLGSKTIPSLNEIITKIEELTNLLHGMDDSRNVLLGITNKSGNNLDSILRDESDPLRYLFPPAQNGEFSIDTFYTDSPDLNNCNQILQKIITIAKQGQSHPVRILEVGAGTGSATAHVLAALSKINLDFEYTFTDISGVFFQKAKKKLQTSANIKYQVFNIELDGICQGFKPKTFDVAIGSNVIHAAKNILMSLDNIKKLLKPDGYLILCEYVQPILALDVAFGALNGWWRFKKSDPNRPTHPFINTTTWKQLYEASGFKRCRCIGFPVPVIIGQSNNAGCEKTMVNSPIKKPADEPKIDVIPAQFSDFPVLNITQSPGKSSGDEIVIRVRQLLVQMLIDITGLEPSEIDEQRLFTDFGLDSLMRIELENSISDEFHLKNASNALSVFPTIHQLAYNIAANYKT